MTRHTDRVDAILLGMVGVVVAAQIAFTTLLSLACGLASTGRTIGSGA